jgi:hypothetical protein
MKRAVSRRCVLLGLLAFVTLPLACHSDNTARKNMNNKDPMMTYPIGRFSINVPQSMKQVARTASLRHRELREVIWPTGVAPETATRTAWEKRIAEIEMLQAPEGKAKALIEERDMTEPSVLMRAVLYFGDKDGGDRVFCDLLTARRQSGIWIKSVGVQTKVQKMMEQNADIARAYHPLDPAAPLPKENFFYLEHGYIELPYRSQEETYTRFEGHPLELKLEFKTTVVHKVSESGLVDRLAASLAMNFAPGVDVDRLRTGKRNVAGLPGEEVVFRGTQDGKSELSFTWLFTGKVDSGDAPKISIEMEAKDGRLEEKLKAWDALLDSIKPVGR